MWGYFRCEGRHERALVLVRELGGTVKVGACVIGVSDSWYMVGINN